jgi:predicted metal-binding protein
MLEKRFKTKRIIPLNEKNRTTLKADLEKYCGIAVEMGASDSIIIPSKWVKFDERVRLKCQVPGCHLYGSSPNCPPYTPEIDFMRKTMKRYRWAVLVKYDVPHKEDFVDQKKWLKDHEKHQGKMHDIVSAVESIASNDGYYFAVGFSSGGCKTALCSGLVCKFLDSGRCRFPLKARPSMEGVGIDAFDIITRAGWEVYPIGSRYAKPDSIKCAVSAGIIFVN